MGRCHFKSLFTVILFSALISLGTTVFATIDTVNQIADLEHIASNPLDMQFNVTERVLQDGGENGSSSQPVVEEIRVIVDTGTGSEVSRATIQRTTNVDGTKHDTVTFNANQAKETVEKAQASGQTTARIVIPDNNDEVSQLDITIPKEAAIELANGGLSLEIYTDNAKIIIPNDSLADISEDFYFRVIPIKDETERTEVEERARVEQAVKAIAGDNSVNVVARPMIIETNLSSRAVDIVLPLSNVTLPTDEQERAAFLADLVIFIEHSDGDRQLLKPEVIDYKGGQLGLKFGIDKFSTFTILNMEGWEEYIKAQEETYHHDAYMKGYPDQTFKPDRGISRAEMAAILFRLGVSASNEDTRVIFPDIAPNYWAKSAVQYVSSNGLMFGFLDGTFKPEQPITRAEMAVIISRWLGLHGEPSEPFFDVKNHWAKKEIAFIKQSKIIAGYPNGSFQPEKLLTRAEAVTMINKILNHGSKDWTSPTWSDVPMTHWAFKSIAEASNPHQYRKNLDGSELIVE